MSRKTRADVRREMFGPRSQESLSREKGFDFAIKSYQDNLEEQALFCRTTRHKARRVIVCTVVSDQQGGISPQWEEAIEDTKRKLREQSL